MSTVFNSSPTSPPSELHTNKGDNMFGPYVLLYTIGEGEFAKVKYGIHSETGDESAVKLIKKENVDSQKLSKIKREISVLKSLSHPNIVKLVEVIETQNYIGIVLEFASGGELFDHILAHRYLKEREACRLFAQLMYSVEYLHRNQIIHRDLKLENLLLDRNRNIIVTDFGFANQFDKHGEDLMATSCGSPCYAAPELVVSEGVYVGSAVDIWSCGVILYAMLAGYLPFDDNPENPDGDNINLLYKYILSTPLSFPDYIGSDARDLLRRMLVPDPTKRCKLSDIVNHRWLEQYKGMFKESVSKSKVKFDAGVSDNNLKLDTQLSTKSKRHTIQINAPIPLPGLAFDSTEIKLGSSTQPPLTCSPGTVSSSSSPLNSDSFLSQVSTSDTPHSTELVDGSKRDESCPNLFPLDSPRICSKEQGPNPNLSNGSSDPISVAGSPQLLNSPNSNSSHPSPSHCSNSNLTSVHSDQPSHPAVKKGKKTSHRATKKEEETLSHSTTKKEIPPHSATKNKKEITPHNTTKREKEPLPRTAAKKESTTLPHTAIKKDSTTLPPTAAKKERGTPPHSTTKKEKSKPSHSATNKEKGTPPHSTTKEEKETAPLSATKKEPRPHSATKKEKSILPHPTTKKEIRFHSTTKKEKEGHTTFPSMGKHSKVRPISMQPTSTPAARRISMKPPPEPVIELINESNPCDPLQCSKSVEVLNAESNPITTLEKAVKEVSPRGSAKESILSPLPPSQDSKSVRRNQDKSTLPAHLSSGTKGVSDPLNSWDQPQRSSVEVAPTRFPPKPLVARQSTLSPTTTKQTRRLSEWIKRKSVIIRGGNVTPGWAPSDRMAPVENIAPKKENESSTRLRYHRGAVDQFALTSRVPSEVILEIKEALIGMGFIIEKDYEFKVKMIRPLKENTPFARLPTPSRKFNMVTLRDLLQIRPRSRTPPSAPLIPPGVTPVASHPRPIPAHLYGDSSIDNGEELRLSAELCRIKNFPHLYILDIKRLKGNVWSYKSVYHLILERLQLNANGRYLHHG